ncbi:MAG: HEPN domain-containing protein [Acidocella sp.]|nr:HEPN domain-containing protein [Acidocella sp.]
MTPTALLEKADRAITSAEVLLRDGDAEGACNRLYYAMFNAARAALILVQAPPEVTEGKSHNGLHSAFNQYLIKPGIIPQALGAEFRRAERLRQISDYLGDPIEGAKAELTLNHAREFIQKIKNELLNL